MDCVVKEKMLKAEILWEKKAIRSLDPIPGKIDRKTKERLFAIERNLRKYEKRLVEVSTGRKKIHDLITEIPGVEGEVLTRRYVDGEIWETICEEMFYSLSYIHRLHNKGLKAIQDRLDQEATL